MRVLLIDDAPQVLAALRSLLHGQAQVELVGQAGDVASALVQIGAAAPDLVVLDLALARGGRGLDVLRETRRLHPGVQVVVLSNGLSGPMRAACRAAGAEACFDKALEFGAAIDWIRACAARGAAAGDCAGATQGPPAGAASGAQHLGTLTMNVASHCHRQVVTVDAAESLQQAALLMREHHVGSLVVVEPGAEGQGLHVAGVITDRDLAIEVLARGGDAPQVPARNLAGGPVVGVAEDAPLEEAVALMHRHGVRRLLVHDAEGLLVGVLSFDDVLPALVAPLTMLAEVMRRGLEREAGRRGSISAPPRPALRIPAVGTAGWSTS